MLSIRPETAVLAASGQEVPAGSVSVGTTILVRPGAQVPLDGVVEKGSSSLDESMLTGVLALLEAHVWRPWEQGGKGDILQCFFSSYNLACCGR